MKTITLENGTEVEISDESYANLQKAVQKPRGRVAEGGGEPVFLDKPEFINNK